jgi:L-threonylcarbamoyladenylate synthase
MKTIIFKINDPAKDIEKIRQAAECIDRGGLVVFPTETVYGIACKVDRKSLARLDEVKKRDADKRYTLHIGDKNKLQDYVPYLSPPARKLVANGWPGPLTIVFEIDPKDINQLKNKLGEKTVEILYRDNTIGIRCPQNDIARELLNLCKLPVVAPSANTAGGKPAVNAKQAIEHLDGLVDIVLDGGTCKYKKSSTVVKISPSGWQLLREGVYSAKQIQKMLTVNILFVCTGNTCRSAMAEGFTKKLLAGKLKCDIDRLEQIGYKITSAGTMALGGIDASAEAIIACDSRGVDITSHKSLRLSAETLKEVDYIFAMSAEHKNDIIRFLPEAGQKCMLLENNGDINDPVGGGTEAYETCGRIIEKAVNKRISELLT